MTVIQKGRSLAPDETVSVVMMTHEAQERNIRQAVQTIETLSSVQGDTMRVRVEDQDEE